MVVKAFFWVMPAFLNILLIILLLYLVEKTRLFKINPHLFNRLIDFKKIYVISILVSLTNKDIFYEKNIYFDSPQLNFGFY